MHGRMILANDDRQITVHAEDEHTQRHQLPDAVAALLDRDDSRRANRSEIWRQHNATARAHQATYQRFAAAA
jgi:hypothetical protein